MMMMMMTRRITATAARNGRATIACKHRNGASARNAASAPRRVRGMRDIIAGGEGEERRRIEDAGFRVARRHGFSIVETPVVESQEVFLRCLGSDTDVVSKEMYSFEDKSANAVALRPEGTAGVMRAVLQDGKVLNSLPQTYLHRPHVSLYERPQKGRYRQFQQLGIEMIGHSDPLDDVEAIAVACETMEDLGCDVGGDHLLLRINSLGDESSRARYRDALGEFFAHRQEQLSADSVERLARGSVLRILDSKDEGDRLLAASAPRMQDFLNDSSRKHFEEVCHGLQALGIPFEHHDSLVRGLDYYCHTAFEIVLRAQPSIAVIGGGRYDGLAETMGSKKPIPAVGWAMGVDRVRTLFSRTRALVDADEAPRRSAHHSRG